MDSHAKTFLFDYLNTASPSGFEMPGQRKWAGYIRQFSDTVECDAYGNAWGLLECKKGPKIMLEAHADEIGFMVKHITKEGFLHIDRIGGSDHANARGRRVVFAGEKGPVRGIIGNTAIHLRERSGGEKTPDVHDLYVDTGASSDTEAATQGLRPGTPGVFADGVEEFGTDRLVGRALDNRIGGFIIAEVFRRLAPQRSKLQCSVIAANCVQEEIGGYGAKMLSYRLHPGAAICLDVTHATDTPGIEKAKHGSVKLGGGPAVTHGSAAHPLVIQRLLQCADKAGIPIQHESVSRFTGTDTDDIFWSRGGIPSALVSLPLRYMHSVVESVSLADVEKVIALLTTFVQSIKSADTFSHSL